MTAPFLRRARRLPAAALDAEQDGEVGPPVTGIHGWALAERGVDRVEVTVDGERAVRARLFAEPRPDVASRSAEPSAVLAGWEAQLDLVGLEAGRPVRVGATAVTGGRELDLGQLELELGDAAVYPSEDGAWLAELRDRAARAATTGADLEPPGAGEIRLAVFTHQLDLGGAQLYLQELLRRLLAAPQLTCAVFAQSDGPLRAELERLGARVHITGQEPRRSSVYESRMSELLPLVGGFGPNVVLVNTTIAFWGVDIAARLGVPSVWAIHESQPVEHYPHISWPPFDEHLRERFVAALGHADRVVFEADATRDLYSAYLRGGAATHIDYGIDLAAIDAERAALDRERLRAKLGIAPDERVVLCMGTIEPRKAQASLAFAFARVAARHPRARLVCVGDNGTAYPAALRAAIGRMPDAARRIEIAPISPATSEWYEAADAFALPSDLESVPRSILEAMAFGLPILAADSFGIPEVVTDGENGLLCEPRCLASLGSTLDRLLGLDPEELSRLGRGASATVRPGRDAGGYAREYLELLTELAGASAGAHDRPSGSRA